MVDPIDNEIVAGLDREQALRFFRRERTRGFRDLGKQLFRSQRILLPDGASIGNGYDAATRGAPVTVQTRIRVTDTSPSGLIVGIGGAGHGLFVWVDGGVVGAAAGNLTTDSDAGTRAEAPFEAVAGNVLDVVVACVPGTGVLAIWLDGVLMDRAQSVDPAIESSLWADDTDAGVFGAEYSDGTPDVVGSIAAPADFEVVQPLSVFLRQAPRHLITARV